MRRLLPVLCATLVLCVACEPATPSSAVPEASEEETRKILDHHWRTFQANDLDGTMLDYTEESILITPDKIYRGLDEIRGNFVAAFSAFPKDSTTMQLNKSVVQQDVGYIIWEAVTPKFKLTYGTDTFIIQNGKILRQTYAGVAASL